MKSSDIKQVLVGGAGVMGQGIAFSFARGGFETMVYDVRQDALDTAMAHIRHHMKEAVAAGLLSKNQMDDSLVRLHPTLDFEATAQKCDFLMEAAPEIMDLKQELFARFEELAPPHSIMATNTSHLPPEEIFSKVKNPSRAVLAHWFNPPQLVPVVEVAKLSQTDPAVWDLAAEVLIKAGKQAIKIKTPIQGLIVNRIFGAVMREVTYLLEKGVAEPGDIDDAIKGSFAFRSLCVGFIRSWDLGGLDGWYDMAKHLFSGIEQ